jgi:hypothetical protein
LRPFEDLTHEDPAWPLVQSWLTRATNDVVVLPVTRTQAEKVLLQLQVTSSSVLGAVALETGGILIDHGWLRLLGSGSSQLQASLATWNKIGYDLEITPLAEGLIVGFDAIGGVFAINGGEFEGQRGNVFYFSPDTLGWMSLERRYSEFLQWALTADLDAFYAELRWAGWEEELANGTADLGFLLYPPPFTKEGRPTSNVTRHLVPMRELWDVQQEYVRQLGARGH